ncbi:MAG: hypothetical protein ACK4M9_12710 [Anaerobacillus sp.]|uniref:hypothetical protein n=1 Tax=Anaerobacillus sp. TaxID=1872506 RepID=UPI00391A84B6
MNDWVRGNGKLLTYLFFILFLILVAFYMYMIRPVSVDVKNKQFELSTVNKEIDVLQTWLHELEVNILTPDEQKKLLSSIPIRPNVEQIIADLERTELETGAVIESLGFIITNSASEVNSTEQQTVTDNWVTILPEAVHQIFTDKILPIKDISVSYVEIDVSINGEAAAVHSFVSELEKLERVVHVQSYNYSEENEEEETRLTGSITFRVFFFEDFAEFITDDRSFQLDYEFDPSKIKRYIPSTESAENKTLIGNETTVGHDSGKWNGGQNSGGDYDKGSTTRDRVIPNFGYLSFEFYQKTFPDEPIMDGDSVFYIVQTGAYTSDYYLNRAIENLIANGFFPRIRGNSLSLIFTAIAGNEKIAYGKAKLLSSQGFPSFVKTMPYRAEEPLIPEASAVVEAVTAINDLNYQLTTETLADISERIRAYETKANQVLLTASSTRANTIEETTQILVEVENLLIYFESTKDTAVLWDIEGLMLDFVLLLNGHEKVTSTK